MTQPKLTYFDFSGSRGEECRLALFLAGVDFEDERIKFGDWSDLKPTTPFGALPTLAVEGKGTLPECNSILTWVGRQHGLHPQDPWEAARHEALMSATEHLRYKLGATLQLSDDEKKTAREALLQGAIPRFGRGVEAQIGDGPFLAGDRINVADLKLYMITRWLTTGVFDHVPPTVFDDYPRLMALSSAVDVHPKVAEWTSR